MNINLSASFQPHRVIAPRPKKKKCFVSSSPKNNTLGTICDKQSKSRRISYLCFKLNKILVRSKTLGWTFDVPEKCGVELEDPLVPVSQFIHFQVRPFPDKQVCFIGVVFQSVTTSSGGQTQHQKSFQKTWESLFPCADVAQLMCG